MKNVSFKIDGMTIIAAMIAAVVVYLFIKRKDIAEVATVGLNPAHQENYINQTAKKIVGEERLQGFFDYVFAAGDILTPWNGVDPYAKETWGIK